MSNTTSDARYHDIRLLGAGGMATVTLAEDTKLGRLVALKRVHVTGDQRGLPRLRREALVGASLNHPNLVSVYDVILEEGGGLTIVMQYIAGNTLRDVIGGGAIPARDALRILDGMASGLDAIHARGIVHRDVKPANVLLGTDGAVKLADLGVAAASERTQITTAGAVVGTFSYMAPEQLEGRASSPPVDIYALSAVAFEMLSGHKARPEGNPLALAHSISTRPPPDLRDAWPQAPAEAAVVLQRGMAFDPRERPRSASELVHRLRAALEPATTESMAPVPRAAPTVPPPRAAPSPAASPPRAAPSPSPSPAASPPRAAPSPSPAASPLRAASAPPPASGLRAALAPGAADSGSDRSDSGSDRSDSGSGRGRQSAPDPERPLEPGAAGTETSSGRSSPPAGRPRIDAPGLPRPRDWRRAGLVALLAAVIAAAALIPTLGSGGGGARPNTHGASAAKTSKRSPAHKPSSASRHTSGAGPSAASSAGQTASPAGQSGPSGSGSLTASDLPSASGASSGATTPSGAVQSFYEDAARHDFAGAWRLADASLRSQLAGYSSFQSQMSAVRSITFHQAQTLPGGGGSAATVAIRTTSQLASGTQQCAGTVRTLRNSGAAWMLDGVSINCTS